MFLWRYLGSLNKARFILWCYLFLYLVILIHYFDPNPRLWLTCFGISLIVGIALYLSTASSGATRLKLDRWQIFRLFLMPFCVSSFSALAKGRGFILIFSPDWRDTILAIGLSLVWGVAWWFATWERRPRRGVAGQ